MTSYRDKALAKGMLFTVSDVPKPAMGLVLGFQHFLVMLGATSLIPRLIVPFMGGTLADTAEVMSTIFFVSGLNTLVQTTFGDRLPIIQGGSFAFLNVRATLPTRPPVPLALSRLCARMNPSLAGDLRHHLLSDDAGH